MPNRLPLEKIFTSIKKKNDENEKPLDVESIFDHTFKEGKPIKIAKKKTKKTAKELMGLSICRDFNKSKDKIHPF